LNWLTILQEVAYDFAISSGRRLRTASERAGKEFISLRTLTRAAFAGAASPFRERRIEEGRLKVLSANTQSKKS